MIATHQRKALIDVTNRALLLGFRPEGEAFELAVKYRTQERLAQTRLRQLGAMHHLKYHPGMTCDEACCER